MHGVEPLNWSCPWDCVTPKTIRLFLIRIYRYKPPFARSSAALSTPDRLLRPFATFTKSICFFPGAFAAGRIKEKLSGERLSIMMCCECCTILRMQEPTSDGAHPLDEDG
jgi:hypothetical protein